MVGVVGLMVGSRAMKGGAAMSSRCGRAMGYGLG